MPEKSSITHQFIARGLDQTSAIHNIEIGRSESMYNFDTDAHGFVSKRKGYSLHRNIPIRIANVSDRGDFWELIPHPSIDLLGVPETPIIVNGQAVDINTNALEPVSFYWNTFENLGTFNIKANNVNSETGQVEDSDGIYRSKFSVSHFNNINLLIGMLQRDPNFSQNNKAILTDEIINVQKVDESFELDLFFESSVNFADEQYTVFRPDDDISENIYYSPEINLTDNLLVTEVTTNEEYSICIESSEHNLTSKDYIIQVWEKLSPSNSNNLKERKLIIPDNVSIDSDDKITINLKTTPKSVYVYILGLSERFRQAALIQQSASADPDNDKFLCLTGVTTNVNLWSLYKIDEFGNQTLVLPDEVEYIGQFNTQMPNDEVCDSPQPDLSLRFRFNTFSLGASVYKAVYAPCVPVNAGVLVPKLTNEPIPNTDSTGFVDTAKFDFKNADLAIHGIDWSGVVINPLKSEFGYVREVDEYRSTVFQKLVAVCSGDLWVEDLETTYTVTASQSGEQKDGIQYLTPYFGASLQARNDGRTRGLKATEIIDHRIEVASITNNNDGTAEVICNVLSGIEGSLTGLEFGIDKLTIENDENSVYNGSHKIITAILSLDETDSSTGILTFTIEVENLKDYSPSSPNSSAVCGIFTDYILVSGDTYPTFQVDDIINNIAGILGNKVFALQDLPPEPEDENSDPEFRVWIDAVPQQVLFPGAVPITWDRITDTIVVDNILGVVPFDIVNVSGFARKFKILEVNKDARSIKLNESIQISNFFGNASTITLDGRLTLPLKPLKNIKQSFPFAPTGEYNPELAALNDSLYTSTYDRSVLKFDGTHISDAGILEYPIYANSWVVPKQEGSNGEFQLTEFDMTNVSGSTLLVDDPPMGETTKYAKYITISSANDKFLYYLWFKVANDGSFTYVDPKDDPNADPILEGRAGIQINVNVNDTKDTVTTQVENALKAIIPEETGKVVFKVTKFNDPDGTVLLYVKNKKVGPSTDATEGTDTSIQVEVKTKGKVDKFGGFINPNSITAIIQAESFEQTYLDNGDNNADVEINDTDLNEKYGYVFTAEEDFIADTVGFNLASQKLDTDANKIAATGTVKLKLYNYDEDDNDETDGGLGDLIAETETKNVSLFKSFESTSDAFVLFKNFKDPKNNSINPRITKDKQYAIVLNTQGLTNLDGASAGENKIKLSRNQTDPYSSGFSIINTGSDNNNPSWAAEDSNPTDVPFVVSGTIPLDTTTEIDVVVPSSINPDSIFNIDQEIAIETVPTTTNLVSIQNAIIKNIEGQTITIDVPNYNEFVANNSISIFIPTSFGYYFRLEYTDRNNRIITGTPNSYLNAIVTIKQPSVIMHSLKLPTTANGATEWDRLKVSTYRTVGANSVPKVTPIFFKVDDTPVFKYSKKVIESTKFFTLTQPSDAQAINTVVIADTTTDENLAPDQDNETLLTELQSGINSGTDFISNAQISSLGGSDTLRPISAARPPQAKYLLSTNGFMLYANIRNNASLLTTWTKNEAEIKNIVGSTVTLKAEKEFVNEGLLFSYKIPVKFVNTGAVNIETIGKVDELEGNVASDFIGSVTNESDNVEFLKIKLENDSVNANHEGKYIQIISKETGGENGVSPSTNNLFLGAIIGWHKITRVDATNHVIYIRVSGFIADAFSTSLAPSEVDSISCVLPSSILDENYVPCWDKEFETTPSQENTIPNNLIQRVTRSWAQAINSVMSDNAYYTRKLEELDISPIDIETLNPVNSLDFGDWGYCKWGEAVGGNNVEIVQQTNDDFRFFIETENLPDGFAIFSDGFISISPKDNSNPDGGLIPITGKPKVFPSRVVVSYRNYPESVDNPYTDDPINSFSAIDVNSSDGQEITGMAIFFSESATGGAQYAGTVIVFKTNSVYAVNITTKETQRLQSMGQGCTIPNSIASTDDAIFFANDNGIYKVTRDLNVKYVGDVLRRYYQNLPKSSLRVRGYGIADNFDLNYQLAVPVTDTINQEVAVYNFESMSKQAEGSWALYDSIPISSANQTDTRIFFGNFKARIWEKRNAGDNSDYRDDDSAISSTFTYAPQHFGDPGKTKDMSHTIVQYAGNGPSAATVGMALDLSEDFTTLDPTNAGEGNWKGINVAYSPPPAKAVFYQIRVQHDVKDEPCVINGFVFKVNLGNEQAIRQASDGANGVKK